MTQNSLHLRDTKFVISCAARTGSTFLVHLLRSNPQILCHGEVIVLERVGALIGSYGMKRRDTPEFEKALMDELLGFPERFIHSNIFDTQGYRIVGFKYKTDEASDPRYKAFTDIIAADKDIKVIHLRRRNLFNQFISHQVVLKQTGVMAVTVGEDVPKIERFRCDPDEAVSYFADVIKRESWALDLYRDHRSFAVDYEDLVDEESPQRLHLQQFLGVKVEKLTTQTKKIIKDSRNLVTNVDETIDALRSAGYADRLA